MIAWCLLGAFFLGPAGLIAFLRGCGSADPYEPAASEAPGDQLAVARALGFETAQPFTGEDTQALIATGDGPAIVAGDQLRWAGDRDAALVRVDFDALVADLGDLEQLDGRLSELYDRRVP